MMLSDTIKDFNLFPVQKSKADMTTPAAAVPMPICFKRLHDPTRVLTKGIYINYVKLVKDFQFYHITYKQCIPSPVHFFLLSSKRYHCTNGRNDLFCYTSGLSISILFLDSKSCYNLHVEQDWQEETETAEQAKSKRGKTVHYKPRIVTYYYCEVRFIKTCNYQ